MATGPAYPPGNAPTVLREAARYWWVFLVIGIAWVVAALVILQFNHASITTVSVILGIMFVAAAVQQFVLTAIADSLRWLYAIFGVLFAACVLYWPTAGLLAQLFVTWYSKRRRRNTGA